ncbi:hypothetical protein Hypma_003213 [Hypsizygus marmoreus]|uniref:F-box domain-containing protein n=1 Tax=Hypsizygus marmoreus TaxID=39966 RepID=A0A369K754_HYPMA|nr:hypothetical protein Hypma_003213 [Hypsizygus marmoreus]
MTTTTIGLLSAPETSETVTTSPYHPEGFAHALLIDLSACEDLPGGVRDPITLSDAEKLAAYKLFLERLRTIVKEDGQKHAPIDMVSFMKTNTTEGPSDHTYRALDGLKPRHAEFHCGVLEECEMRQIDKLKTPWPLDSLLVSGMIDEGFDGEYFPPKACQSLKSLTLDYCCGIKYCPPGGAAALRYLSIIENDAPGMFTSICAKNPGLKTRLQTLVIHDTSAATAYSSRAFKEVLKRCTSLVSLEFVLGPVPGGRRLRGGASEDRFAAAMARRGGVPPPAGLMGGQLYSREGAPINEGNDGDAGMWDGDEDEDSDEGAGGSNAHQGHAMGGNAPYPGYQASPWHGTEFPDEPSDDSEDGPFGTEDVLSANEFDDEAVSEPEALYLDLVQYLPASLEELRFRGPTDVLDDLPEWREAVSNPSWLPNLKTFAFRLDVTHQGLRNSYAKEASAEAFSATEPEVQKFLDVLSASRPSVKIVEFPAVS